jgi:Ca-activated chloride channel family protein
MTRLGAAVAFGAVLAAPLAGAQVFRGGTDLVFLSVTATNGAGQLVGDLTQGDFEVFEDGVRQEITNFARDPQPIALSLVLDSSMSMERKLPVAQEAAVGFVGHLGPRDIAQVVDFDSRPKIRQAFTRDIPALERAIKSTQADGSTSLYDALYVALDELKSVRARTADDIRRWAVIVLSDGEDTTSLNTYEDVLEKAKRAEVIVYAIGLRAKDEVQTRGFHQSDFVLRTLAQETGGRAYFVDDAAQLPGIYSRIADELGHQYSLGYSSKNQKLDGTWRKVNVRVTRGDAAARTRAGYFAPKVKPTRQ